MKKILLLTLVIIFVLSMMSISVGCKTETAETTAAATGEIVTEGLPSLEFNNSDFYDAEGKFQEDKAKEAYIELMKYHGYPVFDGIRELLWVTDYGKGEFTKVGLGVLFFINNVEDGYMNIDLYMLPNQMLPEHWHVAAEGNPPKMEAWTVRYGLAHIVGEGEPNLSSEVQIPDCHLNGTVNVEHEVVAKPGTVVTQPIVEGKHWQIAGKEGAIVTEVANVHTDSGMLYSDPEINQYWQSTIVNPQ